MFKNIKLISFTAVAVLVASVGLTLVQPAPASAAGRCTDNTYSRGSSGNCVRYIQRIINGVGDAWLYEVGYSRLAVDGNFGPATESQVKLYQRHSYVMPGGFPITSDGRVGPNTWASMCRTVKVFFQQGWFVGYPNRYDQWQAGEVSTNTYLAARDAGCARFDVWYR